VSFDAATGELKVPATAFYCVKVDVVTKDAAGAWTNLAACLNASSGTVVVSRNDVTDVRAAFCLPRRFDVCSSAVTAMQGNLSTSPSSPCRCSTQGAPKTDNTFDCLIFKMPISICLIYVS